MSADRLLRTPLSGWHEQHGGRLVEFGGWLMPVQYSTITEEHHAVRRRVGLFDVSHMGRLTFMGPEALSWLERVTTNQVSRLAEDGIQYSLMTNDEGGVIDDVLVYRLAHGFAMVCNASNRLAVLEQLERHRGGLDASVSDRTLETAMIAVQGPAALETLQPIATVPIGPLRHYQSAMGRVADAECIISRTGYTGEDGFELMVPAPQAERIWTTLLDRGSSRGILPCGLGARDTLRFEAGMPLHGHELSTSINPYQAGLGGFVKLEKGEFVGRAALREIRAHPGSLRVGLHLEGKRIARQGSPVLLEEGRPVGTVTSGTFSPTLESSLAMALVEPTCAPLGTRLAVDVRGHAEPARVVRYPFYRRDRAAANLPMTPKP